MKKLILFIFLFAAIGTQAQTNKFPSIDSLKNYIYRYVRNSTVESFTNLRLQTALIGTTELLDSLTANIAAGDGVDTIFVSSSVSKDTIKYRKSGVVRVAGILDRASLKLNITDTTAMLSPYLRSNIAAATYQPIGSYATTSQVTGVQSNLDTTRNGIRADLNGKLSNITGLITAGANVTVTGTGTSGSPYVISSTGGGGGASDAIQNHTSGTTVTIANGNNILFVNPSTSLATLTITLPETPNSSNEVQIYFGGTITSGTVVTSITIVGNTGQTIIQSTTPSLVEAGDYISYKYNSSLSKWFRK